MCVYIVSAQCTLLAIPSTGEMDVSVDEFFDFSIAAAVDRSSSGGSDGLSVACFEQSYTDTSSHLTDLLSIPTDDAAELEWLSRYMDDSFTDLPASESTGATVSFQAGSVAGFHGRPRSKRSRGIGGASGEDGGVKRGEMCVTEVARRCTHCASEKTPQWRAGPLGPKTLCNACGVRYKSGRLVPEYRPAASPTFVLTQHSNSHRKVLELRRQKELIRQQRQEGYGRHFGVC